MVATDSAIDRADRLPAAVWRLVQHSVIALGKVNRLQNVKVERILDFARGASRCKVQIDDDRIFGIIWIELAKCLPNDLFVLPNTRPRIAAKSGRFPGDYLNLLHTRMGGRNRIHPTRRHHETSESDAHEHANTRC